MSENLSIFPFTAASLIKYIIFTKKLLFFLKERAKTSLCFHKDRSLENKALEEVLRWMLVCWGVCVFEMDALFDKLNKMFSSGHF